MDRLKYVMFDDSEFLIFPAGMSHDSVVNGRKPVSAGYVTLSYDEDTKRIRAYCRGDSFTLSLKAREEDSEIVTRGLRSFY